MPRPPAWNFFVALVLLNRGKEILLGEEAAGGKSGAVKAAMASEACRIGL